MKEAIIIANVVSGLIDLFRKKRAAGEDSTLSDAESIAIVRAAERAASDRRDEWDDQFGSGAADGE